MSKDTKRFLKAPAKNEHDIHPMNSAVMQKIRNTAGLQIRANVKNWIGKFNSDLQKKRSKNPIEVFFSQKEL